MTRIWKMLKDFDLPAKISQTTVHSDETASFEEAVSSECTAV